MLHYLLWFYYEILFGFEWKFERKFPYLPNF